MNRRNLIKSGLAALSAATWPLAALAYPERAIRLVVPFSPGGATDVAARLWAERMKPALGTVVIENDQYVGTKGHGQFIKRGLSQYLV